MDKLAELRRKLGVLTDELNTDAIVSDGAKFDAKLAEIDEIEAQIKRMEAAQSRSAALARPVGASATREGLDDPSFAPRAARAFDLRGTGSDNRLTSSSMKPSMGKQFDYYIRAARDEMGGFVPQDGKHFRTFGEQMQAVAKSALSARAGGPIDPRLVRAPTGGSEVDATGGGFLVQVDFMAALFMLAHDMGEILSRVNKIPISDNANGLKINAVDETSRATGSRWGGVQSYWIGEGTSVPTSRPKFRRVEFDLKKLFSLAYMTDELLQDAPALTAILGQAFSEEIMFMTEDAVYEGTGAGMPLGFINSSATIAVPKVNGQSAGTIVKENIDSVWSRLWNRSRKDSVWLINQDALPQLFSMVQAVGTGGAPVYLPPGGYSASPYATLMGRPVIETEYSGALGTPGDIALVDLSQYTLIDKGGVNAATSMHVAFLTDEMVFRITYRTDGQPMWKSPITPFKGGNPRSPFVAIAQR